jgi:hypothetical protein
MSSSQTHQFLPSIIYHSFTCGIKVLSIPLLQSALTVTSLTCCNSLTRTRPRPPAPIKVVHHASTLDLLFYFKPLVYFHSRPPLRLSSSTWTPILHINSHPPLPILSSTSVTHFHFQLPLPIETRCAKCRCASTLTAAASRTSCRESTVAQTTHGDATAPAGTIPCKLASMPASAESTLDWAIKSGRQDTTATRRIPSR